MHSSVDTRPGNLSLGDHSEIRRTNHNLILRNHDLGHRSIPGSWIVVRGAPLGPCEEGIRRVDGWAGELDHGIMQGNEVGLSTQHTKQLTATDWLLESKLTRAGWGCTVHLLVATV